MEKKNTNLSNKKIPEFNDKQKRFCEEYLLDFNGKKAAIRAGYSAKSAEGQASTILRYPKVQEYLTKFKDEVSRATKNKIEDNIRDLIEIRDRCMQYIKPKVNALGIQLQTKDIDGKLVNAYVFDANGAIKAIEQLNKLGGFYPPEKRQIEFEPVNLTIQQPGVNLTKEQIVKIFAASD